MSSRLLSFALLLSPAALAGEDDEHPTCAQGDTDAFAHMPALGASWPPTGPTYPEGIAVIGDQIIVSGPANFGTANNGSPSQLTVFDRETGALESEIPLVGEDLSQEHALSELASKGPYAYAPSTQLGVLRWRFAGESPVTQEEISTPFCSVTIPYPCLQPTDACPADIRPGLPPLPNGIAVDHDGTVYVTDSLQGIVWKVDPNGASGPATPEVLVCSRSLQGSGQEGLGLFGANGLVLVGDDLYLTVTFGPVNAMGLPTSQLYRVDIDHPESLELMRTFDAEELYPGVFVPPIADGVTYDEETDHLLVVMGGLDAVLELDLDDPDLAEVDRYTRADPDLPFHAPAGVALDEDGTAWVTNHAITCCLDGDPDPTCSCYGADELFGVVSICREED